MECNHSGDGITSRVELCKKCRMEAIRGVETVDLLALIRPIEGLRLEAIEKFRGFLPRLITAAELLNIERKNASLTNDEREAADTTYGVFLFAINGVDGFELNKVLKERARRS